MTDADLPQPGWYPDPSGAPALRWWNGVTWSDVTHALQPDAALAAPTAVPPTAPLPTTQVWAPVVPPPADAPVAGVERSTHRWWIPVTALVALLALAAVALAALTGGLGGRPRLDTDAIQTRIALELSRDAGSPVTVSCPSRVDIDPGTSFTCTATTEDGRSVGIVVAQTSEDGDVVWSEQR